MKSTTNLWIMGLLILVHLQCTTDDEDYAVAAQLDNELQAQDPELYDHLDCQGLDLTDAKKFYEHVLVEGDILIRTDEIRTSMEMGRQNIPSGRIAQYVVNIGGVASQNNVLNINYHIASSVASISGNWTAAIDAATQDWENISYCRVSFNKVSTAGAADLVFRADNDLALPTCARNLHWLTYAGAEYPGGGEPGSFISINDNSRSTTQGNRETVIRHELGHALGFRHDNSPGIGEPVDPSSCGNPRTGQNLLVGTPSNDGSSVMIHDLAPSQTINFSGYDRKAATYVYPEGYSAPQISYVTQYYRTSTTRDVKVTMGAYPVRMYRYRVERLPPWSSTPIQSAEYVTTSNYFWLYNVPLGTWDFRITSLNYARDLSMNGIKKQVNIQ